MNIYKIINNNIVSCLNENNFEIIVMGKGLGFNKKKGDQVDEDKIEKIYSLENKTHIERLINILSSIPIEHIDICLDIVSHIQEKFDYRLNENIYISLTDHISFAIKRKILGYKFKNPLLNEIKNIYKTEFDLGMYSINYINNKLNINFDENEASSIALHIVDAEYDRNPDEIVAHIEDIKNIIEIINSNCSEKIKESQEYTIYEKINKFILRIKNNNQYKTNDKKLYNFVRKNYPDDYMVMLRIIKYISDKFKVKITNEEKTILALLVSRKNII